MKMMMLNGCRACPCGTEGYGNDDSQNVSHLIETLIIRLGRTISKKIYTGWLNPSNLSTSEVDLIDVLFVHVLHRLSDLNDGNGPISNTWTADIHVEGTSLSRIQLEGHTQGHNTLAIHDGIALPPRLQPAIQAEQNARSIKIELTDASREVMSIGGGPLQYGSQSILSVGNVAAEGSGYHAVLEVELRAVPRERFEKRLGREHDERVMYAATLGYAFGLELLQVSANDEASKESE
ncbi:hypothetical protein BKA63DRAFT_563914 [Paraphoma chrysanthemicola]|nr:hypothetical protein BKA63DRAFT_563914 [Paraphoma chrysanthemicola]